MKTIKKVLPLIFLACFIADTQYNTDTNYQMYIVLLLVNIWANVRETENEQLN